VISARQFFYDEASQLAVAHFVNGSNQVVTSVLDRNGVKTDVTSNPAGYRGPRIYTAFADYDPLKGSYGLSWVEESNADYNSPVVYSAYWDQSTVRVAMRTVYSTLSAFQRNLPDGAFYTSAVPGCLVAVTQGSFTTDATNFLVALTGSPNGPTNGPCTN